MREILFRGKRKDNGEWVEGYLVKYDDEAYIFTQEEVHKGMDMGGYLDCCKMNEVIPETVGQYTGFVDKFNRKIFEGDIIKTKFGRGCIVEWFSSPAYRGWDLRILESPDNANIPSPTLYDLYANYNLEIVDNIHDFSEELKEAVK